MKVVYIYLACLIALATACSQADTSEKQQTEKQLEELVLADTSRRLYVLDTAFSAIKWQAQTADNKPISGHINICSGTLLYEEGILIGGYFESEGNQVMIKNGEKPSPLQLETLGKIEPKLASPINHSLRFDISNTSAFIEKQDVTVPRPEGKSVPNTKLTITGNLGVADSTKMINLISDLHKTKDSVRLSGRYAFGYNEWGLRSFADPKNPVPKLQPIIDCELNLVFRKKSTKP